MSSAVNIGSVIALLCTATAAVVWASPIPQLTEEFLRVNNQRTGVFVARPEAEQEQHRDTRVVEEVCHTGRLGALEKWRVVLDDRDLSLSQRVEYHNTVRGFSTSEVPCYALLVKVIERRKQLDKEKCQQLGLSGSAIVETLGPESGQYVLVTDWENGEEPGRWLIRDGQSIPIVHPDSLHLANDESVDRNLIDTNEFGFMTIIDAIDGIPERYSYPILSDELQQMYQDELSSTYSFTELQELKQDQWRLLLQEEQELLLLLPVGAFKTTWTSAFSLEDWELVRQKTSSQDRKALSEGWTKMGEMMVASTGNATIFLNCLRRAIAWYPDYVPAFLHISSLLEHFNYRNGSCQTMEKMLERIDPSKFQAGEMRTILTANFPHCSIIIRMANLWETNSIFRYVIAASIVISFLHGMCMAIYFFHDTFRWCCFWRRESSSLPAAVEVSGISHRTSKRKNKRE